MILAATTLLNTITTTVSDGPTPTKLQADILITSWPTSHSLSGITYESSNTTTTPGQGFPWIFSVIPVVIVLAIVASICFYCAFGCTALKFANGFANGQSKLMVGDTAVRIENNQGAPYPNNVYPQSPPPTAHFNYAQPPPAHSNYSPDDLHPNYSQPPPFANGPNDNGYIDMAK